MKGKKTLSIAEYELPVTIREEEGVFIAQCPKWKDCFAQGNTLEEAINEISYVASSLIELYQEEDLKIPLKLKKSSEKPSDDMSFTFPLVVSN
ncbi:hypothetical protein COU87_03870 [Candidatus Roizmanbacteria bacterium CG10_big_fil_rev_8_21_14_0_10_39_12]|uniref:Type II toxin-antitoxin system HicB family antitoxin n=1 Tax=Candidatus Roizmanbacteria bacterium CG10_big_fil_rev_8_21_14_0_10_39_12 TaxID=1974852 RepID=A0A2M8KNR2_9BACT|nr:MAG: hypothetical protein COY15_01950 [Candidatus Roizmanbacteria bacterium CG_4_10_14_0_2_um_filter_39_12]PJE61566.1 MAG: hypothetical protein COU87_03870 [Candidatus Roizmanbacteria bacterium CG10_big_fil_rev_8_21_14_0_10_39_12]